MRYDRARRFPTVAANWTKCDATWKSRHVPWQAHPRGCGGIRAVVSMADDFALEKTIEKKWNLSICNRRKQNERSKMAPRPTLGILGFAASILAASVSPSFAQNAWRDIDCASSRITHPALNRCQEGPKTGNGGFDAWIAGGNLGEGRPAQVNLYRAISVPNFVTSQRDSLLEESLKSYYAQYKESVANSTLSTIGDLKVLRFKTLGSGRDCAIFHRYGDVVPPSRNAPSGGFTHFVRGFLCAAENETVSDSQIQELASATKVR